MTGTQWIATTSTPVQMNARVITSTQPLEYVDGTEYVEWSVDPPGFATIDRLGRVTPVAIGSFRVVARVGDKSGTNSVRVLPDYSGNWSGEFVIASCTGGNDFRECPRMMFGEGSPGVHRRYPFTVALSQDRDQVSGTLRETRTSGDIVAPVAGFVRLNGQLVLEATVPQPNQEPFRVINWASIANAAATTMSGAFTQIEPRRNNFGTPYSVRTEQEFVSIARAQ